MKQVILPNAHDLNGTGGGALLEQRTKVLAALREAAEALAAMTPHGRDYIGDNEKYGDARDLHVDRQRTLTKLYAEIEAETRALADLVYGSGA